MKQVFAKFRHYLFFNQEVHVPSSRKEVLRHEHILHYIPRCFNHQNSFTFLNMDCNRWSNSYQFFIYHIHKLAFSISRSVYLDFFKQNCWRETWPKKVKNHIHQHPIFEKHENHFCHSIFERCRRKTNSLSCSFTIIFNDSYLICYCLETDL